MSVSYTKDLNDLVVAGGQNTITATSENKTLGLAESDSSDLESYNNGDFIYARNPDDTYFVKSIGTMDATEITIKSDIGGTLITEIGDDAFKDNKTITKITIPPTIRKIGARAFKNSNIKEVVIEERPGVIMVTVNNNPGYVPKITTYLDDVILAEKGMTRLEGSLYYYLCSASKVNKVKIMYGKSGKGIARFENFNLFHNCLLEVNGDVGGERIIEPQYCYDPGIIISEVHNLIIENEAFYNCPYLEKVSISRGVSKIGERAFEGCTNLSVEWTNEIVDSLKIGDYAFYDCPKVLENNDLPFGLEEIGAYALPFDQVTTIDIPPTVKTIAVENFSGLTNLESITCNREDVIPARMEKIEDKHFKNLTCLKHIDIPSSVTSIGEYAFEGCKGLSSIKIPKSLIEIKNGAFYGCKALTELNFNESTLDSIGVFAFSGCIGLSSISLDESPLREIKTGAFYGCQALTEITLPDTVSKIEAEAFFRCYSLESINIPTSLSEIKMGTFKECSSLARIIIPDSVTLIWPEAFSETSSKLAVVFSDVHVWFLSNDTSPSKTMTGILPQDIAGGFDTTTPQSNGAKLRDEFSGKYWHKLKKMLPPEISRDNNYLTITDPLGLAEIFYIYVDNVKRVSIDMRFVPPIEKKL